MEILNSHCGCLDWLSLMKYERENGLTDELVGIPVCDGENHYEVKKEKGKLYVYYTTKCNIEQEDALNKYLRYIKYTYNIGDLSVFEPSYQQEPYEKCIKYVQNKMQNNLILKGTTGAGKTFLSKCMLYELAKFGYKVCFMGIRDMQKISRDCKNINTVVRDGAYNILTGLKNNHYIVIDELGGHDQRDEEDFNLFFQEYLDKYCHKTNLIFTTNLRSATLQQKIGDKNFSRLLQNCKLITFNNFDYRKKDIKDMNNF